MENQRAGINFWPQVEGHNHKPENMALAKSLILMSRFAFGGRLWMNVADGRHRPAPGICPQRQ
jgi:hypothetical protein